MGLLQSIGCYDDHLKRGEAIKSLCASQCLPFDGDAGQVNADQVIFYYAVNVAKKLCSDVLLNQVIEKQAIHKIEESKLLLQYLLTLDSITKNDKEQIQIYVDTIGVALDSIRKL